MSGVPRPPASRLVGSSPPVQTAAGNRRTTGMARLPITDRTLTAQETADYLSVHVKTLRLKWPS